MPDISMCGNQTCPSRKKCYRFMAIPSTWQSYIAPTWDKKTKKCEYFWPIKKGDRVRNEKANF